MRKTNKMVILRPLILSLVLLISYAMTATQPQALYKEASPEEVSAFFAPQRNRTVPSLSGSVG